MGGEAHHLVPHFLMDHGPNRDIVARALGSLVVVCAPLLVRLQWAHIAGPGPDLFGLLPYQVVSMERTQ